MNNWREQEKLEVNSYINKLTKDYNIQEVSSDIQLKNGTIMFKCGDELFGVYKSGMVRKIIRTRFNEYSCYQLNLTRPVQRSYMWLKDGEVYVRTTKSTARVLIPQELARLVYLKQYLIKNKGLKKDNKKFITVDGIKYIRYEY